MKLRKIKTKAQSQIIATVLLILLVLSVTFIVIAFIFPFVQKQLKGSGCVNVVGEIGFRDNPKYTCFENGEVNLQVYVGDVEDLLGFKIGLGGADSITVEIRDGEAPPGVTMFDGSTTLELPGKNEERTYIITSSYPDNVKIFPILADKTCKDTDTITDLPLECLT